MFRLVLIHQLVLAVLVGPMLCCCTAARLGHDPVTTHSSNTESGPKTCCGGRDSSSHESQTPGDKQPTAPAKCPCKDGPVKALAAPTTSDATTDTIVSLSTGLVALYLPVSLDDAYGTDHALPRSDDRSSSLSTADLLFAHHNLRC